MRRFAISPGTPRLIAWVQALPASVTDVVLREPTTPGTLVRDAGVRALHTGRQLWIHERCEGSESIAIDLGCGLHLTSTGSPTSHAHGRSCHTAEAIAQAFEQGASHVFLSPVFSPTSKPGDQRPTLGLPRFLALAGHRPVVALGGMTGTRMEAMEAAGAWGCAALGAYGLSEVSSKTNNSGS